MYDTVGTAYHRLVIGADEEKHENQNPDQPRQNEAQKDLFVIFFDEVHLAFGQQFHEFNFERGSQQLLF